MTKSLLVTSIRASENAVPYPSTLRRTPPNSFSQVTLLVALVISSHLISLDLTIGGPWFALEIVAARHRAKVALVSELMRTIAQAFKEAYWTLTVIHTHSSALNGAF